MRRTTSSQRLWICDPFFLSPRYTCRKTWLRQFLLKPVWLQRRKKTQASRKHTKGNVGGSRSIKNFDFSRSSRSVIPNTLFCHRKPPSQTFFSHPKSHLKHHLKSHLSLHLKNFSAKTNHPKIVHRKKMHISAQTSSAKNTYLSAKKPSLSANKCQPKLLFGMVFHHPKLGMLPSQVGLTF